MGKGKKGRMLLALLLVIVFLVSAVMAVRQEMQYRQIAEDRAEAAEIAGLAKQTPRPSGPPSAEPGRTEAPGPPEPQPEPQPEPLPEEAAALVEIDLEALRAVNEDVAGWLAIPGTEVSYPLVQGTDNRYYLSRNWKKERSDGGAVFLESTNSSDLGDFHTIVYAHRMRDDSMFGALRSYKDADFWREHPSVYVVLDDGIHRYDIFSAREAGVKGIVYRLDIEESHLEEELVNDCLENSAIDTGLIPEAGERILTLSTCTGHGHAARWVVHAVEHGAETP